MNTNDASFDEDNKADVGLVVGIGASAGGLRAFTAFLKRCLPTVT